MKVPRKTDKKSVDRMMRRVAFSLVRDFQENLQDPTFCCDLPNIFMSGDLRSIRDSVSAVRNDTDDIPRFKATYQIQSLLKRYRFQSDIYSDQELQDLAVTGFCDTQDRLAHVHFDQLDAITNCVLDVAASYVANILGDYDDEEHRLLCRFGRKASVGVPAREASEASRWQVPISGSLEQISWFDSEMSQVESVQKYLNDQLHSDPSGSMYRETSFLTLTLVPKTFKSLRSIMPNTTIGSYMSLGLGEMMRRRLKSGGYDIRSLQMRHRVLACRASRTKQYVTADLSAASDSITDAMVKRLFPKDWYDILVRSRIGEVALPNGSHVQSLTFCTMGIGYTFPLQTLVFLALLKAIESVFFHTDDKFLISVYGDDMIYHHRLHAHVLKIFSKIGLVINLDKTYDSGNFRESCGGDYFRGVDVRPFQPRNGQAYVSARTYEAVLYKFINGLLMRWSEYEIRETLDFLTSELLSIVPACKLVPGDYPDDSGIKCHTLGCWDFLTTVKCSKPKAIGHGVFRFSYLRLKPDTREEKRHDPYLWRALRPRFVDDHHSGDYLHWAWSPGHPTETRIRDLVGLTLSRTPSFITKDCEPKSVFRSKLSGRRLRRTMTMVTISHTGHYTRQSGTSCFEDRR